MANKIRRIPLRTEGHFCSISGAVVMMVNTISHAASAGSVMLGTASKHKFLTVAVW